MTRPSTWWSVFTLLLLHSVSVLHSVPGLATEPVPWSTLPAYPLEQAFLDDVRDGTLDEHSFEAGALIASGVTDPSTLERYRALMTERGIELQRSLSPDVPTIERAQQVLAYLHDRILTGGYSAGCTRVDETLERGDFNCVSATALYLSLCRVAEVPVLPVATPSHMYARLQLAQIADVQTTHRDWDIGRSVRRNEGVKRTGKTRVLTPTELIGKIYYNRAVLLLDARRYAEALPLLERSQQLDPHDANTSDNLLAAINNWALLEAEAGQFEKAATLVRLGLERNPRYEPLRANDLHIHQKWSISLTQQKQFERAVAVLEARHMDRPDVPLFDAGRFCVYRMWGEELLRQDQADAARKLYSEVRQRFPGRAEAVLNETTAFVNVTEEASRQGDLRRARQLLEVGLEGLPNSPTLLQLRARLTNPAP